MLHALPPLLLADITDLIGPLVGFVVLVMWVIRQIVDANKQMAPPRGRPQAAPQAPMQGAAPAAAGQQADPLRNQVEDFLRRAGRGPQGGPPRPQPPRAQAAAAGEVEVLLEEQHAVPDRRPLAEPFRPVEQVSPPPVLQPIAAPRKARSQRRVAQPRRESVAEHVAENIAAHSRGLAEQASRLGQRIIQDDQQFDIQLKAKFDHTVGTLTGSAVTAAEQVAAAEAAAATPAAQIAVMLASPDGVRQAIVINEILRRPSDRW